MSGSRVGERAVENERGVGGGASFVGKRNGFGEIKSSGVEWWS